MQYRHQTLATLEAKARDYLPEEKISQFRTVANTLEKNNVPLGTLQEGIDTAAILADLKMGFPTVLAGLLKPICEDEKLSKSFDSEAIAIAKGAKKLDYIKSKNASKVSPELLAKLLLATSKDIRMLIVKLGRQLMEMRFLHEQSPEIQQQEPRLSLDVFVPISHKLGLHALRWEMEDLSMKYLYPAEYEKLKKSIVKTRVAREQEAEAFKKAIQLAFREAQFQVSVFGRAKNFYRIFRKMQEKNLRLDEVHDQIACRVVCNTEAECYQALDILQQHFQTVPKGLDDYIAKPKPNGYRSLHVEVQWQNQICEAQIRTWKMHTEAEDGLAAHWEYRKYAKDKDFDANLSVTKQIADWLENQQNQRFMETLRVQFEKNKLFVFTPKNELIELSENSTPVDFAYAIHSSLGEKCEKAKVNGKLVPLDYRLENGDTIEIITSEKQVPKRGWLSFVQTDKAKNRLRSLLEGQFIKKQIPHKIKKFFFSKKKSAHFLLAKCCNPLPGDEVIAYRTTKRKTIIHRKDCTNITKVPESQFIEISEEFFPRKPYDVEILVKAANQAGILAQILNQFAHSECKVNSTNTIAKSNSLHLRFNVQTKNAKELEKRLEKIRKITGVQEATRL